MENNPVWYYSINNEQKGPVSRAELEALAKDGRLRRNQLVWTQAFGSDWREAAAVPGLFPPAEEVSNEPAIPTRMVQTADIPAYSVSASDGTFARNAELTRRARESMRGNWGMGVAYLLIYFAVFFAISLLLPAFGGLVGYLFAGPLQVGVAVFFLNIARKSTPEIGQIFEGFTVFGGALAVYLLTVLFTFLWFLLLIIPGIIASIAYSQVYFLLADHRNLSAMDAIRSSVSLMRGHKWQYFFLGFRFIGWFLLGILSLGIGFLWIIPYFQATLAEFYLELRKHQKA